MSEQIQIEYETNLSQAFFRVTVAEPYIEDYQIPMLQRNPIDGILSVEGCGVNGGSCYTYGVGGCISMSDLYIKTSMKKQDIQELVDRLLEIIEALQQHMLNPDCLMLEPEYLFRRAGKWWFCYLPGRKKKLTQSFHELSEYFVKTLDYEDVEGIFLAYELHKATLQEKYDLTDYECRFATAFAQGKIGRAVTIATSKEFAQLKEEVMHVIRYAKEMTTAEIMAEVKNIANYKLTIDDYLDLMAMWYRDVLVFKSTKDSNALIFKDEMSLLAEQAKNCSYEGLEDILKSIDKVKLRLKANVNFDLVIELLIMAIKEAM